MQRHRTRQKPKTTRAKNPVKVGSIPQSSSYQALSYRPSSHVNHNVKQSGQFNRQITSSSSITRNHNVVMSRSNFASRPIPENSVYSVPIMKMSTNPEEPTQVEPQQKPRKQKKQGNQQGGGNKKDNGNAAHSLAVQAKKSEDFSKWYSQLVVRSELIEYYDISGCYILRPWAYQIWEQVQSFMDAEFKKLGVKNSYFPMFVPKKHLETEKDHVEGFSAEVAWVTHSGTTKLDEPIAVRPTSETIMYPAFSKWIHSHRDLPLKLNQWCNVVRWEFKDPTPFIRSREFLWQEGHTAHATLDDAAKEVLDILEIYARTYRELLACSVIKGTKTEYEKFAGGYYTTTIEGFIPNNGRAIQAATSHCLGQNFSKMFDIKFFDENNNHSYAWQNSWGFTTRSLGVMFMTHSDDKGLVLPPRIAPIQVVFVPIYKGDNIQAINDAMGPLADKLKALGIRVEVDDRTYQTPGFKYNAWELKGVPLRIEVGSRDLEKQSVVVARRDTGKKSFVNWDDLEKSIPEMLDTMQVELLQQSESAHLGAITKTTEWDTFIDLIIDKKIGLLPFCGDSDCEKNVKIRSEKDFEIKTGRKSGAAKSLCIPFEQPEEDATTQKCFCCGNQAQKWTLFGRSY